MDIDDIFKRPPIPKGSTSSLLPSTKRKLEQPNLDPESYKHIKLDNGTGSGSGVTIEDEGEEEGEGESFAPGQDADYFEEEDEDGRFFGGGLSSVQKQVLNIMETGEERVDRTTDQDSGAELTSQGVKKMLLQLEKTVNKNRDLRTKFPNDPEKFVDSEFNLIEAIHGLMILSSSPIVSFPLLIELSTVNTLADLLSHENEEVSIAVVQVLEELVDPEGIEGDDDDDEEEGSEERTEKKKKVVRDLLEGIQEAGIVEIVVSGLERFDEKDEDQRTGVFHTLSFLENLITLFPPITSLLLSPKSTFLPYLYRRLSLPSKDLKELDQNRYYAAEMMAFVLSQSTPGQGGGGTVGVLGIERGVEGVLEARMKVGDEGWVEGILKILSVYRKRDPHSGDETEFMENLFDVLCSSLSSPLPPSRLSKPHPVKSSFLDSEGIELMLLLLKSSHDLARSTSLKCLSHALGTGLSTSAASEVEEEQGGEEVKGSVEEELGKRFVDCLGLKTLFAIFMGKSSTGKNKKSNSNGTLSPETIEHIMTILSSLFTSLASDSPPRLRLLTKFIEQSYSKLDRLLELREQVEERIERAVKVQERLYREEGIELSEDEVYLEKLDNGGMSLQLIDYVAAWVCMEDDGAREHYIMLLSRQSKSLKDLVKVLSEYRDNINIDEKRSQEGEEERVVTEGELQRAILDQLVEWLDSVA